MSVPERDLEPDPDIEKRCDYCDSPIHDGEAWSEDDGIISCLRCWSYG